MGTRSTSSWQARISSGPRTFSTRGCSADVLGTSLFDFQTGRWSLAKGPIFTELLLADEINRTPPKTQAALLQSMQEHRVTAGGHTYPLGQPFHVFATQNPIEQEGTYPLPEAQLDRFMFLV